MLTIWLVVAAFLYWPFRKLEATYKAPLISALLWPLLIFIFLGALIWGSLFNKDKQQKSVIDTNISTQDFVSNASKVISSYTSTPEENIALAKQFLANAKMDLMHDYYYAKNIFKINLREEFDFSIYSLYLNNLYNKQEEEGRKFMELLSSINNEDFDPRDYRERVNQNGGWNFKQPFWIPHFPPHSSPETNDRRFFANRHLRPVLSFVKVNVHHVASSAFAAFSQNVY